VGKGKWDPWSNMDEFRQQVERLLDDGRAGNTPVGASGYVWAPLADVLETAQALIAQVELPGIRPEQVVVEIVDGDLVVRGERPFERGPEREEPEPAYHLMERAHGTFARRFSLPAGVDGEGVSASLSNGLLVVTVPKIGDRAPVRFSLDVE
jgi:HSP20 family protein